MPLSAIEAACQDVRQNRVPDLNPDWPPSSVRMVALARVHLEEAKKQHAMVKSLLAVTSVRENDQINMEVSTRVGEGLRQLANDFQANLDKAERERNEALAAKTIERNRQEILHEHQALGIPPIMAMKGMPVSVALRRNIAEYRENMAKEHGSRREDKNRDQGS